MIDKEELNELVNKFCEKDCFNLAEDEFHGDYYCAITNCKYTPAGDRIKCPLMQFMDEVINK